MKKRPSAPKQPLYIVLISVHGLVRGHDLELGRDADTGGQIKYVVELARALGERADIEKVILLTRRVIDSQVSPDYAEPLEALSEKASIVRIECGEEKYLRKELLWDCLENFSDNALVYLKMQGRTPDIIRKKHGLHGGDYPTSSTVIMQMPVMSARGCRTNWAFRLCIPAIH